ncbi:hypothetical protein [Nocardia abscessus]|uniref:hypothetical protein n=1 Tax=Nocardia abscessus TaxID=120957 RepID=UPI002454F710|nr:hypothetical protein [Nocardia abscessus]
MIRYLIPLAVGIVTSMMISWPWWLLTVLPVAVLISVVPVPERVTRRFSAPARVSERDLATDLAMVKGGLYRNEHGGELHAIEPTIYLNPGRSWRMPAYVFGEVWLMESRSDEYGTIPYLATREGLREHGFALVEEADRG